MKIAIIGAGAMGCIYGARLSVLSKTPVYLLDIWQEHLDAINREGILLEEGGVFHAYTNVRAISDPKEAGVQDLVLVFVKSTMTQQAIGSNVSMIGPDTVVLTLQNGLGNIDALLEVVPKERILAGTTAHGGTLLGPGKVRHAGKGKTYIGEITGQISPRAQEIANLFNEAQLDTEISDNGLGLVWGKLISNVGINALTAITGLLNGQILENSATEELMTLAVLEAKAVADALGIQLSYSDPVEHTRALCRGTAPNRSSMLQDVTAGRKTEIDMINGASVREGIRLHIPTPINLALTNLIKALESKKDNGK